MEENLPEHPVPDNPPPYRPPELRVRMVLGVQVLLFILCTGVFQMIALLAGWDTAPTLTAAVSRFGVSDSPSLKVAA